MINQMTINGVKAVITYDPDIDLFRGEISLRVFMEACQEDGVEPFKSFSGKFNVRIPTELHAKIVSAANGKSLNQWTSETLSREVS